MNKKTLIRAAVVVVAVAAVIIITQIVKSNMKTDEVAQPVRPVKTLRVETIPKEFRRVFPGRLQSSQTINLSFLYAGDLISIPAQEGQLLAKGELVAALNDEDARSNLDAAAADLNLARVELERNQTLFDEDLISASEFDVVKRRHDVSKTAYDKALKALNDHKMLAPFDGMVAKRFVDNYEKVQAGQTVITLIDPSGVDIVIDLPESVVLQIPNFEFSMTAEFEQNPGIEFPLEVKEFATVADSYTKTYAVTLHMNRPDKDVVILPDMTVSVNMDVIRKESVDDNDYMVPSTAIVYDVDTDGTVIWIVDETTDPMTVNPREVNADRAAGGEVVVNEGLEDGDLIVIAGGGFLTRDQPVWILE